MKFFQGLIKFLVDENGFNRDRVTKVSDESQLPPPPQKKKNTKVANAQKQSFSIAWFVIYDFHFQAIEKIKAAKDKSSQGRWAYASFTV